MKRWMLLLCMCLSLGLVVAGCGGDDDDSGDSADTAEQPVETTPASPDPSAGSGGGKSVKVDMKDIEYVPQDVTVPKGGTVAWTNGDSVPHTVTKEAGPGGEFDSGTMDPGDEFEQKFEAAGKIDYFCEIHPNQKGTVTVE